MKEIVVLTGYSGFFGQTRKPWISIDTDLFGRELASRGIRFHRYEFHEIVNSKVELRDSYVFYSFSHRDNLRHYIRDCLLYLESCGNTLIPSLQLFDCHENKGWQELFRKIHGLKDLNSYYFSSKREMADYDLKFPLVFKTLNGSNSTGVALVHSFSNVHKELAKRTPQPTVLQKIDFWRRRYLRKHKEFPGYPNYDLLKDATEYQDYMSPEIPFVLQEFIPGLSYDYRVIVLGDKYFISKRHTKARDFRASGAKLFDFHISNPESILDKAKEIYSIMHCPFISLDFGEDDKGNIYLFEFQASHFGVNAIVRGGGYYQKESGDWHFRESKPVFERYLAQGLVHFLEG